MSFMVVRLTWRGLEAFSSVSIIFVCNMFMLACASHILIETSPQRAGGRGEGPCDDDCICKTYVLNQRPYVRITAKGVGGGTTRGIHIVHYEVEKKKRDGIHSLKNIKSFCAAYSWNVLISGITGKVTTE